MDPRTIDGRTVRLRCATPSRSADGLPPAPEPPQSPQRTRRLRRSGTSTHTATSTVHLRWPTSRAGTNRHCSWRSSRSPALRRPADAGSSRGRASARRASAPARPPCPATHLPASRTPAGPQHCLRDTPPDRRGQTPNGRAGSGASPSPPMAGPSLLTAAARGPSKGGRPGTPGRPPDASPHRPRPVTALRPSPAHHQQSPHWYRGSGGGNGSTGLPCRIWLAAWYQVCAGTSPPNMLPSPHSDGGFVLQIGPVLRPSV